MFLRNMTSGLRFCFLSLYLLVFLTICHSQKVLIRWCAPNAPEYKKCSYLSLLLNSTVNNTRSWSGQQYTDISSKYDLQCVQGVDLFQCMAKIQDRQADIMNVDMGMAYQAAERYALKPIMVENYSPSNVKGAENIYYSANVIVPKGVVLDINNLTAQQACFGGVGTAEGWMFPLSVLFSKRAIEINQCNSIVDTIAQFFSNVCAPSANSPAFNPFGDNSDIACSLCYNQLSATEYCASSDPYAGSAGALYCLENRRNDTLVHPGDGTHPPYSPTMAFVRAGEIDLMRDTDNFPADKYQLLCPEKQSDGTYNAPLTESEKCAWGPRIQSRVLVTTPLVSSNDVDEMRKFFSLLVAKFGSSSAPGWRDFPLFGRWNDNLYNTSFLATNASTTSPTPQSTTPPRTGNGTTVIPNPGFSSGGSDAVFGSSQYHISRHLMFSEFTKNLFTPPPQVLRSFYTYRDKNFETVRTNLEKCPLEQMLWCVISVDEMQKCERMKNALDAKRVKPSFNCVNGGSKVGCMQLIRDGFADMMTVDAAELYTAGTVFNLVPFAAEFYGDDTSYYAVGIVKKVDPVILISNFKYRRLCSSGVGKATGWVIPVNLMLDTQQIRVYGGHLIRAISELVARACIPGILNNFYNPSGYNAINLCEICSAGGDDRCQRDSRELYYGDAGAFRCLLENGDVAFARHTTVHDFTNGRHMIDWARDRRSHDYQLLCSDGGRAEIEEWRRCNLGKIPGSTVVTSRGRDMQRRRNLWQLLQYAQEYYSSDTNTVFRIFDSGFGRHDLMFTDSATKLVWIDEEKQDHSKWLGRTFIRKVENLLWLGNTGETGMYNEAATKPQHRIASGLLLFLTAFMAYLIAV